ncbi:hypothetical protein WKH63_14900 [Pantoea agglomerans]|uniref:hypothetical protein n=1 Tax=Enterobacter agglomerans TaxID=549 RepID=UPI003C7CB362
MSNKEWAEVARAVRKEVKTAIRGPRSFATGDRRQRPSQFRFRYLLSARCQKTH